MIMTKYQRSEREKQQQNKQTKQTNKQTNKKQNKKQNKKPRPTKNFIVYSQRQRTNSGLLLTNPTPQQLNKVRTKQKAHCLQNRLLIVQSLTRSKQQQLHKILKKLKPIARK